METELLKFGVLDNPTGIEPDILEVTFGTGDGTEGKELEGETCVGREPEVDKMNRRKSSISSLTFFLKASFSCSNFVSLSRNWF